MSPWQRAFGVLLFLGGGAAAATWGVVELVGWLGSLSRAEGVIQTDNFLLGLPLLGIGLFLLAPEFVVPHALSKWPEEGRTHFYLAALGTMLVGLVLVFLGQIVISVVMGVDGYRACHVGGLGRITEVTWARENVACPPGEPGR